MSNREFNIAVIGPGFGAEFIPLWQKHPHTNCYAICQRNALKAGKHVACTAPMGTAVARPVGLQSPA